MEIRLQGHQIHRPHFARRTTAGNDLEKFNAREYGFYSNVNPNVDHPRWSQATEQRIGEGGFFGTQNRPTLMFNGYDEVASLYTGMDLKANY